MRSEVLQVCYPIGRVGWAIPWKLNIRSTLFMVSVDPSVSSALDTILH